MTWDEVRACRDGGDEALLAYGPREALGRVEQQGDLFAPVLTVVQALPATG